MYQNSEANSRKEHNLATNKRSSRERESRCVNTVAGRDHFD